MKRVYSKAELNMASSDLYVEEDYYTLTHNPRGVCMIINNENFLRTVMLTNRAGTQEDAKALDIVFTRLGFKVEIHNDLTAEAMQGELIKLGKRNFMDDDALVVCILSHGEKEIVFGTDGTPMSLRELTSFFRSGQAPSLAGKPKLFFIEGSQGSEKQKGSMPCPPRPRKQERDTPAVKRPYMQAQFDHLAPALPSTVSLHHSDRQNHLEEDGDHVDGETVPWDADFLFGMASVPEYVSFRNRLTGAIYTQELCRQLYQSAESSEDADIFTVLTRVNREVSKGEFLNHKQMPEFKSSLTKKLVLKFL